MDEVELTLTSIPPRIVLGIPLPSPSPSFLSHSSSPSLHLHLLPLPLSPSHKSFRTTICGDTTSDQQRIQINTTSARGHQEYYGWLVGQWAFGTGK